MTRFRRPLVRLTFLTGFKTRAAHAFTARSSSVARAERTIAARQAFAGQAPRTLASGDDRCDATAGVGGK